MMIIKGGGFTVGGLDHVTEACSMHTVASTDVGYLDLHLNCLHRSMYGLVSDSVIRYFIKAALLGLPLLVTINTDRFRKNTLCLNFVFQRLERTGHVPFWVRA